MAAHSRRCILTTLALGCSGVISGCSDIRQSGSNPTLEIQNNYSAPVTLQLSIEKNSKPSNRTRVYDSSVTVQPNHTRSLDVLGDDQFYIEATWDGHTHEFGTRPICDNAYTTLIITESGALDSDIRDCGA